ncbi:hypothetical protein ACFSB1_10720 [Halopseudomonas phragmitis]|uniref:DUF3168 domain-containing protein n=1 Tax=Halopseudomonas phragmitis TaxID=1931241 RepID=A0A1V0B9G9_9GAMM|nr:hypothetical protein [Halopseudomonas phragmitis]AQZ96557.1 hypothetical protein BVH74_18165 [Halopseudomonas phragmitis]
MSEGANLTDAIVQCLGEISPANGFHTDIKAVYGPLESKPDKAPLPCLLVSLPDDGMEEMVGPTVKRLATYVVEAQFSRVASLQDMQRCHHDILRALGYGQYQPERPLKPGAVEEESVEYDQALDGATQRAAKCRLQVRYIEHY